MASFDRDDLYCEAVSASFVAAIADVLTPDKQEILYKFGFKPQGASLNYSRRLPAGSIDDLRHAVLLAVHTLQFAYSVSDFSARTFTLNIP